MSSPNKLLNGLHDKIGKKMGVIVDARASLAGVEGTGGALRLEGILAATVCDRIKLTDVKIWLYEEAPISSSEVYIPEDRIVLMYIPQEEQPQGYVKSSS